MTDQSALPDTLSHGVWVTGGVPTEHPLVPAVRQEVEPYEAYVEVQLDPTVIVRALLEALVGPADPGLRARLAAIAADPAVVTACRLRLPLPVAERLAEQLAEASLEPEQCSVRSCVRYAAWGGACHGHGD